MRISIVVSWPDVHEWCMMYVCMYVYTYVCCALTPCHGLEYGRIADSRSGGEVTQRWGLFDAHVNAREQLERNKQNKNKNKE